MSITSEIERIKTNIANAYTKCEEKGATMPSVLNSANLVQCIASITGGGSVAKQLIYQGTTSALSAARQNCYSGNIGEYALLCIGGNRDNTYYSNVDAYTGDLTKVSCPSLSYKAHLAAVGNTTDYLIVAGGYGSGSAISTVNTYDATLTRGTAASLVRGKNDVTGTGLCGKALFAGGYNGSSTYYSDVECYDNTLAKTTATALSEVKRCMGAGSIGNTAIFAGGYNGSAYFDTVETYSSDLVKGTITSLSVARAQPKCAKAGNKILVGGGDSANSVVNDIVDVYSESLVKETPISFSVPRYQFGATEMYDHAFFCCGKPDKSGNYDNSIDVFNPHLVRTTAKTYLKKSLVQPVCVGNYLLSGGGYNGSSQSAVEVFELVG